MLDNRHCLECGQVFAPVSVRHKFHTYNCMARFNARRKRMGRQEEGLCPQCGKPNDFPLRLKGSKSKGQRISYCSRCRERFRQYNRGERNDIYIKS